MSLIFQDIFTKFPLSGFNLSHKLILFLQPKSIQLCPILNRTRRMCITKRLKNRPKNTSFFRIFESMTVTQRAARLAFECDRLLFVLRQSNIKNPAFDAFFTHGKEPHNFSMNKDAYRALLFDTSESIFKPHAVGRDLWRLQICFSPVPSCQHLYLNAVRV